MRVPRVQFTVRTLLAVVAIVALVMAGEKALRKSLFYRKWAIQWRFYEEQAERLAGGYDMEVEVGKEELGRVLSDPNSAGRVADELRQGIEVDRRQAAHYALQARHYRRVRELYEKAIWRPWDPVKKPRPPAGFWDDPYFESLSHSESR